MRISRNIGLALCLLAGSFALTTQAKNADEVRIYLNPGHGGYGPNDRPMATIPYPMLASTGRPDTLGFYESNTNLWKVEKLRATLINMGVKPYNIVMSRVKCGPYPYDDSAPCTGKYDRSLSEISEEADAGNFDMFFSVHSDAATEGGTANRSLYLYRGTDDTEYVSNSKAMALALWKRAYVGTNGIDYASSTGNNLRGDISFYGSSTTRTGTNGNSYTGYLGVLKHGVPGFLAEGYCHTYQPARHRALNRDYCRQEGVRYARGMCDYFGLNAETTGYIMGAVKDKSKSVSNSLYTYKSGTRAGDEYYPVMGAKVLLYKDNELIDVYTTDNNYNGVFVFDNLEPGTYTLRTVATGYADLTSSVTVTANETTYPLLYVSAGTPSQDPSSIEDPNPADVQPITGMELENDGGHTYDAISGTIKETAQYGDVTVVLTTDAALYKIDNTAHTVTAIPTTGITSDSYTLSSLNAIAFTTDGTLLGINKTTCTGSTGTVRVYKWSSLNAAPTLWLSTKSSCGYAQCNIGESLTVNGPLSDCVISATATNSYPTRKYNTFRILNFTIEGGELSRTNYAQNDIESTSPFNTDTYGTTLNLQASPFSHQRYIVDGESSRPYEFLMVNVYNTGASNTYYNTEPICTCETTDVNVAANHNAYFNLNGNTLMAVPTTNASGTNTGLKLFDITYGLNKAQAVATTNTTLSSATTAYSAAHANLAGNQLNLYLIKDNTVVKFVAEVDSISDTPDNPDVPDDPKDDVTPRGIFAYGLDLVDNDDDTYTFKFTPNVKPQAGQLVFYNTAGTEVGRITLSEFVEGENAVTIAKSELPGSGNAEMTWAVELTGEAVTSFKRLNDATYTFNSGANRVCATVDNSPESRYFGQIYASTWSARSSTANGLFAFRPDWSRINTTAYRGGVTFTNNQRIGVDPNGTVYLSDYGDATSGIYLAYPEHLDHVKYFNFFGYDEKNRNSDGLWSLSGTNLGSSTSAVSVAGTGVNTRLFVFLEDFEKNNVAVYDLVDDVQSPIRMAWYRAPSRIINTSSAKTTNCGQVQGDSRGGVWVSHYNSDNTSAAPSLVYANASSNILFNSATATMGSGFNGTRGGGFALTRDESRLAIGNASGEVCIYDVTWSNGTPSLSYVNKYTVSEKDNTTNGVSQQTNGIYQLAFDWGGNLVVSGKGLGLYSVPSSTPNTTVTPARKALTVTHKAGARDRASTLRVYINPGHGGYGPNDRPQATISHPFLSGKEYPDTLGFYESNTNLWKAFELNNALQRMGVKKENIVISRVSNGPFPAVSTDSTYNTNVNVVATEIEMGHYDVWISIHSNAAGRFDATKNEFVSGDATENYPLILFNGTDDAEQVAGSKALAQAVWRRHWLPQEISPMTEYSIDDPYIAGEWSWYPSSDIDTKANRYSGINYKSYLGVSKHGVPGFLIEGFCHTYGPDRHRALNEDYCRQMGVRIARGVADYYGLTPETTGYIMGTVKDKSKSVSNSLYVYHEGTVDQYWPVMGATVKLYKEGTLVSTYTTDNNYNGIFVFSGLEPGSYKIVTEASGYDIDEQTVTVEANETTYPLVYLETDETTPRGIFAYGLKSTRNDDGSYDFTFTSNARSQAAGLVFYDMNGNVIDTRDIDNVKAGVETTITLNQQEIPWHNEQELRWGVTLTGKPVTEITKLNTEHSSTFAYTRAGVTVDNSPESDYFGAVYVNDRKTRNASSTSTNRDNGIYRYNPLWERENSSPFTGNMAWDNNYRISTDYQGTLYIPDYGDNHSGVFIAYPDKMSDTWQNFFAGSRILNNGGMITRSEDGVTTGCSSPSVFIAGSGADTKMYASLEDIDMSIHEYDLGSLIDEDGNLPDKWYTAPTKINNTKMPYNASNYNSNTYAIAQANGGLWVSQNLYTNLGTNTATSPALRFISPDRTSYYDYTATVIPELNGSAGGGMALSRDESQLVIVDNTGTLQFFNIDNSNAARPTLTWTTSFTPDVKDTYSATANLGGQVLNGVYQMCYDWGGNLYVAGGSLGIYSMPTADNTHTTPAKQAMVLVKDAPVNATLAQILAGEEYPVNGLYTLADDYLVCIYVSPDKQTLYLKDHGNLAVDKLENDGRIDYLALAGLDASDQSNWVAVTLPQAVAATDDWEYHRVTGVTGVVESKFNPVITATAMPTAGSAEEYTLSTYTVANFEPENWLNERYFFVNPKPMEVAKVTWAQWDASSERFVTPEKNGNINQADLSGSIDVSTEMLTRDGELVDITPSQLYKDGEAYRFRAVVKKNATVASSAPRRAAGTTATYTVYPLSYSAKDIVTAVTSPVVARTIVTTSYYDLSGRTLGAVPEHGAYIQVVRYSDGTTESHKFIR